MKFERHLEIVKGRLDMTPLIDVVLLLLLFFILASSYVLQPGIRVELPLGGKISPLPGKQYILTLTSSGLLFFGDQMLEWADLPESLEEGRESGEERSLLIRADGRVTYEQLARIMEIARQSGFRSITWATRPSFAPGPREPITGGAP
jgi:biopolymer transport protein ExbD